MKILEKIKNFFKGEKEIIHNETISKLPENETVKITQNVTEVKNEKEIVYEENLINKALVVDTSALKDRDALKIILEYPQIILLIDVVNEMDQYKKESGYFGYNIRNLFALGAKDTNGEKIKIVKSDENGGYTDNKLIQYCEGKNVVLYTADNGLALKARGYGIEYILAKDTKVEKRETMTNFFMKGKDLFLRVPQTHKIEYIVFSESHVKEPISNLIKLNIDDNIIIATYKKNNSGLVLSWFKITDISATNHAKYLNSYRVGNNMQIINGLNLPEVVKRKLRNYFFLVRSEI